MEIMTYCTSLNDKIEKLISAKISLLQVGDIVCNYSLNKGYYNVICYKKHFKWVNGNLKLNASRIPSITVDGSVYLFSSYE